MSRQDKATTDRNARTLRELVKRPDNKNCADCKKNDARWASWNLGLFICIRCSGIHRSMGTHISKVKSIDLDIWQPEQMDSVQRWGNRRANCYWEAHLKAGHVPPDHKMESFIRSKYESRRWAMSGPIPHDPSIFDGQEPGSASPLLPPPASSSRPPPPQASPGLRAGAPAPTPTSGAGRSGHHALMSTDGRQARPPPPPQRKPAAATAFDLLGDDFGETVSAPPTATQPPAPTPSSGPIRSTATAPPPTVAAAHPKAAPKPSAGLFDLDFKAPPPGPAHQSSSFSSAKSKTDIMSLFKTVSPAPPPAPAPFQSPGFGGFGGQPGPTSPPPVQDMFASLDLGGTTAQAPVSLAPVVSPGLDFTAPRQPSFFSSNGPAHAQASSHRRQSSGGASAGFANPPSYAPNPQQSFASWGGGGTSTAPPVVSNGWGETTAPVKLPSGMGGDVWGASAAQETQPNETATSPTTSKRKPSVSNPYLASGADVWGSPASSVPQPSTTSAYRAPAPSYNGSSGSGAVANPYAGATAAALGGFGETNGGIARAQNKAASVQDDPFGSDIWK